MQPNRRCKSGEGGLMAPNQGIAGNFAAELTDSSAGLTVADFVQLAGTPGNVGVCLSGGGSRALSAGMGQLRALSFLQVNGLSLLSQTRAISTVSGGSWLGVTFEFLTAGTTDAQFLNDYVADPGRLVPTTIPGHSVAETLDVLPAGNIGNSINGDLFSVPALAVQAYLLYKFKGTPANFLWQALMGLHILGPYGLYRPEANALPESLFSWDAATLASQITGPNPALAGEAAHLVAGGAGHQRRPFLICNTAMFLNHPGMTYQYLAPVQSTPFMTGIVGSPDGTDANGRAPGGGGVTSFAFSSNPTAVAGSAVQVDQARQLALADIVGASSAAFAETLENLFAAWEQDPSQLFKALAQFGDEITGLFGGWFSDLEMIAVKAILDGARLFADVEKFVEAKSDLRNLQDLIPQYQYWPVAGAAAFPVTKPTRFADGGNLENLGVGAMLSCADVERLIAFVNTDLPLAAGTRGVIDAQGNEVAGTRVIVTQDIPPLFGYQPYQPGVGYVLYAGASTVVFPEGRNSCVFPPAQLGELLAGLWAASGSGTNATAAVFKQTLAVQDNAWFGVKGGGRKVSALWVYNNRVRAWYDQLIPQVQAILGAFTDPSSFGSFPNYSTFDTGLSATQINLLASLAAWVVAADENSQQFAGMYAA
jgi:hypothetical protein